MQKLDLTEQPPPPPLPSKAKRQAVYWRGFDRLQHHPGTGLTPETVVSIFREAEYGPLRRMMDLFDDIVESDGNLRALYRARIEGVSGKDWLIQPGGDDDASKAAAIALEQSIRDEELDFVEFLEHQLDATFKGFSVSEIEWVAKDGLIVPDRFIDVPHRRFTVASDGELLLRTEENTGGESLTPGRFVVSKRAHANLARAGLFRTATWLSLFKRMAFGDWMVFAEKFGVPIPIGEIDETEEETSASREARTALEEALTDLGDGGSVILEKGMKIYFADGVAQREGDVQAIHPAIVDHCDAEIAKLITGATLTSDSGGPGSFALGKIHEGSFFSLKVADAVRFSRTFLRDVAIPFTRYNGFDAAGARPPRLKLKLIPELGPKTKAEVAALLVDMGIPLDGAQLRDELGFRAPTNEADAATRQEPSPPAGSPPPDDDGDPGDGGGEDDGLDFEITWEAA